MNKPSLNKASMGSPASRFSVLLGGAIKKLDRFGHPITLTYDNEPAFKSVFGGVMTILSIMIIVAYLGFNVHTALTRGDYKSSFSERIRNSYVEDTVIPITAENFDYAV